MFNMSGCSRSTAARRLLAAAGVGIGVRGNTGGATRAAGLSTPDGGRRVTAPMVGAGRMHLAVGSVETGREVSFVIQARKRRIYVCCAHSCDLCLVTAARFLIVHEGFAFHVQVLNDTVSDFCDRSVLHQTQHHPIQILVCWELG